MTRYVGAHGGQVLTWWLPRGLTKTQATKVVLRVQEQIKDRATPYESGYRHDDFVAVTSPGGWRDLHGRGSTVKVRGCEEFRVEVTKLVRAAAEELVPTTDSTLV